jgi:hypothetical protein
MADDPKLSQRYRELPREEPPRHLDDAILAASRRAVAGKKRHWYVPLAAAAVIVLAVAVTVHVDRERPSEEVALSQAEQKAFVPDPKPAAPAQEAPEALAKRDVAPRPLRREAPAAAPAAPTAQPEAERRAQEAAVADARQADEAAMKERRSEAAASSRAMASAQRAPAAAAAKPAPQAGARLDGLTISAVSPPSPEQWLLAIDDLKRQGKHEEAEKQLAEFRKRYPDYLIPEGIAEKFEKR